MIPRDLLDYFSSSVMALKGLALLLKVSFSSLSSSFLLQNCTLEVCEFFESVIVVFFLGIFSREINLLLTLLARARTG